MKYLSLLVFLFLLSCSGSKRSFSSIDDARESIKKIIQDVDVDGFLICCDQSNLPNYVTENIEEKVKGLLTQASSMNYTEVLSYSKEEYEAYCKLEHEKIPESIRHNFNETPTWNRIPERYLIFRYGSSESSTFDLTVALFRVDDGWRIASGYYPQKN